MSKAKVSEKQNKIIETLAILILVIFALLSHLIINTLNTKNNNDLSIFLNGKRITKLNGVEINLESSGTYAIGDLNSEYNIIEIKDKKVRCIDANCPDKICVSHGFLNPDIDNDMIICAPHKLIIQYN